MHRKVILAAASAVGAPTAATATADPVMVWSASITVVWTTGGLFDWREILRLRGDIRGSARSLGIGFPRQRACQQNCRRYGEDNYQLTHRCSP
jgi:hypothetical protein